MWYYITGFSQCKKVFLVSRGIIHYNKETEMKAGD